jgi:acetyl-CoA synthetase
MTIQIKSIQEYQEACQYALEDPEAFWAEQAETFEWIKKWDSVFKADMIHAHNQWFIGGKLNITINCLDRHLKDKADQTALIWEPNEPGHETRKLTYRELYAEVCRFANALKSLGVTKGDRICFYMPMIPQLVIGILACARIGAIHSVVFAGFSASSLADRINDATCKLVICSDYNSRGPKHIPVKTVVDEALTHGCESIEHVIVFSQLGQGISWHNERDLWWHDLIEGKEAMCEPEIMDSEDPLFILYTSGSTGKPKGVVHTCGGYMVFAEYTFKNVFQYEPREIYWCTADIGWVTGHSYIIYGPLLSGATTMMFEGVPMYPDASRFWQICEKHKVNIFYTAPTAIRALMAAGNQFTEEHDLSSIRVLGTVGEPINEEAWHWYHDRIGRGIAPVIDTWWQTETGGIMITPLPGITDTKPCYASYPLPGIQPILVDTTGKEILDNNVEGLLCIKFPWPSMIRTTYGDHGRCKQTYFSHYPGLYFTGDGARRDNEGRYRIIGRVDDVINVSGHRLGTAEIEDAINQHPNVVESAVVGFPHHIKGQGIFAYIIPLVAVSDEENFKKEVNEKISEAISHMAKADEIMVVTGLPKTRSGKIMRRLLRKVAEKDIDHLGDLTTLLNPEVMDEILKKSENKTTH